MAPVPFFSFNFGGLLQQKKALPTFDTNSSKFKFCAKSQRTTNNIVLRTRFLNSFFGGM